MATVHTSTKPLALALLCCAAATGCGGDGGGDAGGTSASADPVSAPPTAGAPASAPTTGDTSNDAVSGDAPCLNMGEQNLDCPAAIGPWSGACAAIGPCCHRASNVAAEAQLGPDEPGALEYRLVYSAPNNHPNSLSSPLVLTSTLNQLDAEQVHTLWTFSGPRMGGELVSGEGSVRIGAGRYNCDGTYSYYGDAAAPASSGSGDPARWAAETLPADVDVSKQGTERQRVAFETNQNRELSYVPYILPQTGELDWELVTQGFDILEIDTEDSGRDCIGERASDGWQPGGRFVVYTPLAPNAVDIIDAATQSFCQLVSFGILPDGQKQEDCTATPRCVPGEEGCPWVKLPDSLCPQSEQARALWGCHLGAEGNPNAEPGYPDALDCTPDAPTAVSDPEQGQPGGQCCDPLGASSALPACNAFRLINDYVAAAVEIRDAPSDALQPLCN